MWLELVLEYSFKNSNKFQVIGFLSFIDILNNSHPREMLIFCGPGNFIWYWGTLRAGLQRFKFDSQNGQIFFFFSAAYNQYRARPASCALRTRNSFPKNKPA